ncbi:MAG TPA: 2-oxo acid dehydrogenase subunit E2, partial [Conexibacter sp.]|nr:2-oxo acid dehydrogenase subunit E2 [Conexibacter sp.]
LYRIEPRPVVHDGDVVVRKLANLSITFDHRTLDGLAAAAFLARAIELIEAWPPPGAERAAGGR